MMKTRELDGRAERSDNEGPRSLKPKGGSMGGYWFERGGFWF